VSDGLIAMSRVQQDASDHVFGNPVVVGDLRGVRPQGQVVAPVADLTMSDDGQHQQDCDAGGG
jgi:hypothetical protein